MSLRNRIVFLIIIISSIAIDLILINFLPIKNTDFNNSSNHDNLKLIVIIFLNLFWIVLHYLYHLVEFPKLKKRKKIVFNTLNAFFFWFFVFMLTHWMFFKKFPEDYRIIIKLFLLILFIPAFKIFFDYLFKYLSSKGIFIFRVIIAGFSKNMEILKDFLIKNSWTGYRYIGYIDEVNTNEKDCLSANYNDILQLVQKNDIQEIFVMMEIVPEHIKQKLLEISANYPVRLNLITDLSCFLPWHHEYHRFDQLPVISVGIESYKTAFNKWLKNIFDLSFTIIIFLIFLWWLIPLIALLIRIDSKGPVFFTQIRTGYKNRLFTCLKFRTMYQNKDADLKQASPDDIRITRIGKILRKYSLDEIPQFFNVLAGQMSVVGPRPHMVSMNNKYTSLIAEYYTRHRVKPGMTGLAQVRGYRGEIKNDRDMQDRIKFDIFYIENWSIWLDIKIILLTLRNIITAKSTGY